MVVVGSGFGGSVAALRLVEKGYRVLVLEAGARFADEDFAAMPMLAKGYIGPQVLGEESASRVRYLCDPRVVAGTRWVTGANEPGRHVIDLV